MSAPDMKSVEPKINKAQFARAVQEGYYDSMCHDPMIRYSVARGFHVESKHVPADDDVIWSLQCWLSADDGKPYGLPSAEGVKAEILGDLEWQSNKAAQELVDWVESEKSTIPDHWDTGGEITASSCPEMEFHLWRVHAKGDAEWSGEEFTLQTFEDYIDKLKEEDS